MKKYAQIKQTGRHFKLTFNVKTTSAAMHTLLKRFLKPIRNHLFDLVYYLDLLASEHTTAKRDEHDNNVYWNTTFLFPLLALIVSFAYGNIFMFYSEEGCGGGGGGQSAAPLTIETLSRCPVLMYHQIFPRKAWPQLDTGYFITGLTSACTYAVLLLRGSHSFPGRYIQQTKQPIILRFGKRSKLVVACFGDNFNSDKKTSFVLFEQTCRRALQRPFSSITAVFKHYLALRSPVQTLSVLF